MMKMIQVRKKLENTWAVDNVTIHVAKGSIYGLLGSNGAGKTTLLKIMSGIYLQDDGEVIFDGNQVFENPSNKRRIFFIQDSPYFIPQYTVKQMANFYSQIYSRWDWECYEALIASFEMNTNKKIHRFSKGIQRQAAFIFALSAKPDVLILDEPMDGLDPVLRKKIKSLIIDEVAAREMTVIISSHNLREVEDLCDTIGIMHKGKLILEKDIDDLKSDTHKIQIAFKGPVPPVIYQNMKVLHKEKRGSIVLLIAKGDEEEISSVIQSYQPIIFDLLHLTLEEIFIYEMEDVGYAVKNILN
ncbi:acetoin utilization transport system ATP-binding protein [Cytobacillus horneckiae]|uniref:ABC transporter ATP-binding protein n=1 Tax=Cytobacillus horneckiae TaxID=549687 RepID=A0A2N0ZLK1_9BACI|nr:ABC transporter ATP-binding protein [Cytobacillus horneckiae]MBN6885839.1 ABC transporter ATP-binding protein [Cytobacillus horneckiae]MCM3177385.1 ABC transporter ATP-binding protein [Cytobacillus horneckiae]MEC1156051.1 ABC transporter ATP-binding protein [Cytobacillus horneckiae]MED2937411.1 ABC transporter ATP-binding protein [Cytobacillus horneckiae]PKG30405.1 ABC transporter ATP-binding protein [Cytobacillus horneckiae]